MLKDRFNELILRGVWDGVSDFYITGGHPVVQRKHGVVGFTNIPGWSHKEIDDLVRQLLRPNQMQMLKERMSVDIALSVGHVRTRINAFNSTRGLSMSIRLLPGKTPSIESLNIHPSIKEFSKLSFGLVLICGTTGCGKSTTIAAMLEEINKTRRTHIVTIEDPIEFRFLSRRSFVEQRELGTHVPSYFQGLMDVLREAADVIVIGEMRDPETIRLTLNAVESGHLVIATLHGTNAEDAIQRICNSAPPDSQHVVRHQLASTLSVVIIQHLLFMPKLGFRVPVLSIMRATPSVKALIRDDRFSQLESAIQTGRAHGMYTMEAYKTEFLDTKTSFVDPSVIFRPSEEASTEKVYRSSLMDDDIFTPGPVTAPSARSEAPEAPRPMDPALYRGPSDDGAYVIEETESIEDVIAQISKE